MRSTGGNLSKGKEREREREKQNMKYGRIWSQLKSGLVFA
jgi:hypothetical protein